MTMHTIQVKMTHRLQHAPCGSILNKPPPSLLKHAYRLFLVPLSAPASPANASSSSVTEGSSSAVKRSLVCVIFARPV